MGFCREDGEPSFANNCGGTGSSQIQVKPNLSTANNNFYVQQQDNLQQRTGLSFWSWYTLVPLCFDFGKLIGTPKCILGVPLRKPARPYDFVCVNTNRVACKLMLEAVLWMTTDSRRGAWQLQIHMDFKGYEVWSIIHLGVSFSRGSQACVFAFPLGFC